jgi:NTP pyrophosphatase (non-canonical NTP hydrolase)
MMDVFEKQVSFQQMLTGLQDLPADNLQEFVKSIELMQEEIGEVLREDKRWKAFRNKTYDMGRKLDEMADMFIVMMNIMIYSGVTMDQMLDVVSKKIDENTNRVLRELECGK